MDHPAVVNKPAKGDRILVVDDAPDNSFLIQSILREEGYQIEIVDNGKDALERVNEAPPDLILLDVMMPQMDGFEVTRRIRQNTSLPYIPILLITAYDKPSVAQGLDTGAEDFIRKPVELDELLARVRSLLKLKHNVDERARIARQREDFVSRLTHDLRTPLVAADRMLSLIQQGALGEMSPDIKEALSIMTRSNQDLLEMVNTLLAVYCYEAGSKTISFTSIDLKQLLEEVIQALMPIAVDKGLALKSNLSELTQPVEMRGDRMELRRVFTNLIGNAIKFTDAGAVTVRLSNAPNPGADSAPGQWVQVEVEDTGPGIAPEYQSSLFEPFRHGNHKRSGSGLGLHLSSQIVNAHHGTIEVESALGQGCLFTVQLPTQPAPEVTKASTSG
jgi:two-component system, sensor histidine kinase and response regulator